MTIDYVSKGTLTIALDALVAAGAGLVVEGSRSSPSFLAASPSEIAKYFARDSAKPTMRGASRPKRTPCAFRLLFKNESH